MSRFRENCSGLFKKINRADKKISKKLHIFFNTPAIFLYAIIVTIASVGMFMTGFHNMDLCHNEMNLEHIMNKELQKHNIQEPLDILEVTMQAETWQLSDCYIAGLRQLFLGFIGALIGIFVLGVTYVILAHIYYKSEVNNGRKSNVPRRSH